MELSQPEVEKFGVLDLPLGGKNGYKNVRKSGDKFQGVDRALKIFSAGWP